MGIHGIYKEIGPGRRVALSKLAVEKFEETGRPMRIAIDTSIWLFQIQASKGGTNPALRTFYYRLLRLIALTIHPIFVFDGPNKPPFKRNKRTGPNVASIPEFLAKQLLKQFGFPIHLAPGEAEAECALLQREGIVDAVLSEDVDTLMFGSGVTIRNWSPEKTGKTPTHVNVYDAVETKNGSSGLDREGMILVALMSGGDYVPEGIPGCGPKTACEAAKAGFGSELCKIPRNDAQARAEWRERLRHELKTNESKFFKRKHGTLKIPDDFPRVDILGYYTHPAISGQTGLDKLHRSIDWDQDLDFPGLRSFTYDAFDWVKLEGAKHFIRSLAPSLLVRQLRIRSEKLDRFPTSDLEAVQEDEALLVKGLHGKRQHPVTDNSTELRVSFVPMELVKIDLSKEDPDDDLDAPPPSSQVGEADLDEDLPLDLEDEGPKKRGPTKFDPEKAARIWVMETFVKVGVPLKVQDWEAERQIKLKPRRAVTAQEPSSTAPKARGGTKRSKATTAVPQAPIERFAKITKPGTKLSRALAKTQNESSKLSLPVSRPEQDIIEILSSSPVRQNDAILPSLPARQKSPSPVLEELPSSVTKRRRRGPMQRSRTLPTGIDAVGTRSSIPPLLDTIETLDLVNPPAPSSPLTSAAGRSRRREPKPIVSTRECRGTSVTTGCEQLRQTTIDAWRSSASPTRPRNPTPVHEVAPMPAPSENRPAQDDIERLDLTLSSPLQTDPSESQSLPLPPRNSRRTVQSSRNRPPLLSISPNASSRAKAPELPTSSHLNPTLSQSDLSKVAKTRRTSPPFRKADSAPEIETLDMTSPRPRITKRPSSELDTVDLTGLSSPERSPSCPPAATAPASTCLDDVSFSESRRSPQNHKSVPSDATRRTSPPAAWKAQEKKKRHIILRQSVAGSWTFADAESVEVVAKGKDRRKWRESEVEVLDLT